MPPSSFSRMQACHLSRTSQPQCHLSRTNSQHQSFLLHFSLCFSAKNFLARGRSILLNHRRIGKAKMGTKQLTMKLLIDKENKKVLFAEAGKDVVDCLFYLLSLPLGTVANLLSSSKKRTVGSLNNLYTSVENLDMAYIQPGQSKSILLEPAVSLTQAHLLLPKTDPIQSSGDNIQLYKCSNSSHDKYYVKDPNLECQCKDCGSKMSCLVDPVESEGAATRGEGKGFVKDMMTYMVLDDLVIKPMSTISCICLLNEFNVKDIASLQEKVVDFGMDEGLKMLEASLKGKQVLTSVFV